MALEYRSCHWPGGSAESPQCVRPMGCWFFPVPRPPYVCAVSWATWLLFTAVPARFVVLRVRCPGPLGSRSPVRPLGVLCCVCGLPGHLAPVHRCARSVCCFACAVSWATWLLFTGVPARCVVLRVRCPGPLGSYSPVCPLGALFCLCGVLGHLAPVHWCARSVCCVACAVSWATWLLFSGAPAGCVVVCAESWATWLLFTGAPARCVALRVWCLGQLGFLFTGVPAPCVVLRVRCPRPLGSCSPVCPLSVLCCACGVVGHLAPVHRCARSVRRVVPVVSWATWLLFTCALARCVASRVRRPGPLGSCSPVCPLRVLFCVCGVSGHLAPVHRCARSVCCFACAVSWATWLLFTGVPARWVCCVCGVLGHLAPVHRCARSVCCFACAVSWATWLLFTGVPARCVVLCVRCPGPLGSCSPVRPLGVLLRVCGVLGPLAPVHRCAHSVCCFACAVSWATWLLFTGVPARCVVLCSRCPGPLSSCSPVRPLGVLLRVCGILGPLAPVHRCARSVCCFACALPWALWLLFTCVPAQCVVWCVRCPGPLDSCSPVRPLRPLLCLCGVLGHLAPVHRCARSVCCFACAVSWATWPLFTGVPAMCVVLRVRCPGPLGSCSPVRPLRPLLCVYGVLRHLAPVHRCARSVCSFACAVSCATWLLFTGAPARWVLLRVRCPGLLGYCTPVCLLCVLCSLLPVWCCVGGASLRCAHSSIRTAAVRSR